MGLRSALRTFGRAYELAECEKRLYHLLEHRAAADAGWYIGYDNSRPGELHRDIERYRGYVDDLRSKLGYPPFEEPQFHFERNPLFQVVSEASTFKATPA